LGFFVTGHDVIWADGELFLAVGQGSFDDCFLLILDAAILGFINAIIDERAITDVARLFLAESLLYDPFLFNNLVVDLLGVRDPLMKACQNSAGELRAK
jgi:hypothetical protein